MSLKSLKIKIRGIKKTQQVTKAMEAVSAVKMRKAQESAFLGRPYAVAAVSLLARLSQSHDVREHPLVKPRHGGATLIILITSDRGLAGNLNSALISKVKRFIEEKKIEKENVHFITIGRKGHDHFSKKGYKVVADHSPLPNLPDSHIFRRVAEESINRFANDEYGRVYVAYNNFLSTLNRTPVMRQVLPFEKKELEEVIKGIAPVRGRWSEDQVTLAPRETPVAYTYEPDADVIYRELLPMLLTAISYHGALESKASEFSARMVAMKNATDKAKELGEEFTSEYNKLRQSSITREVSEIIGGMEALNSL